MPRAGARNQDNLTRAKLSPGPELEQLVRDYRDAGCRVWRAVSVIAPRTTDTYLDLYSFPRQRVGLYLELPWKWAARKLTHRDRTMLRHLGAAVRYDINGEEWDELARGYLLEGDPRPGYGDGERRARDEVRLGREIWAKLDAWPWAWWPNGSPPDPREWREHGADPRLAAAFETWASGAPVLPE